MPSNMGGEEQNYKKITEMQMLKGQAIVKYAKTIQGKCHLPLMTFVKLTEYPKM